MEEGIWQVYRDDGVHVFGINDESLPVLEAFLEQVDITFPVLRGDPDGYTLLGGLSPFPRDFIVDPDGIVQYAATEYRPTEMTTIIERLLPTAVGDDDTGTGGPSLPRGFALDQNFPNPFNPSTTIRFEIDRSRDEAFVELAVFDLRGRMIRTLVSGVPGEGVHRIHWDGTDDRGASLPSGVYFSRLTVGDDSNVRKMILAQ